MIEIEKNQIEDFAKSQFPGQAYYIGTFKESPTFKWDDDKSQYTNGKYYIYFQPPTRNEKSGDIFAVCCIMPIELVNK